MAEERELLVAKRPAGVILFRRNCADPEQLRQLITELHEASPGGDLVVCVDQEGGRVMRLAPPAWPAFPPMGAIGALAARDAAAGLLAARTAGAAIAVDLRAVGFDVACAPVLDVLRPGATAAIGDRAFAGDAATVAALGTAFAEALLAGGVAPVMKHLPGHGAARVDSHHELPMVDCSLAELRQVDCAPFRACRGLPLAITAHVLYSAIDPRLPATLSRTVIEGWIRGEIGFEGVLISDDLAMSALSGSIADRASAALDAGCDLALVCTGRLQESSEVLERVPVVSSRVAGQLRHRPSAPAVSDGGRRYHAALANLLATA